MLRKGYVFQAFLAVLIRASRSTVNTSFWQALLFQLFMFLKPLCHMVSKPSHHLDFKEAQAANAGSASGAGKEDKFNIGTNDINTHSGESIFQVISDRYIKSGYSKLFEVIPEKN